MFRGNGKVELISFHIFNNIHMFVGQLRTMHSNNNSMPLELTEVLDNLGNLRYQYEQRIDEHSTLDSNVDNSIGT